MAKKVEFNLEIVKKYIFWACVPIGLVVAVVAGMASVGNVASKLDERKKQLDSQLSSTKTLQGSARTHPNQGTIDKINEEQKIMEENVRGAWKTMAGDQKIQNPWPVLASTAMLDIESKKFLDTLAPSTLVNYRDHARPSMRGWLERNLARPGEPELKLHRVQLYDSNRNPVDPIDISQGGSQVGGGGGNPMGMASRSQPSTGGTMGGGNVTGAAFKSGKVVWDSPQLEITMRDWQGQRPPQSFEVWLTQEDLWVYQALLWVIAASNKDARMGGGNPVNVSDSVVMQIVELSIGKQASQKLSAQASGGSTRSGGGLSASGPIGIASSGGGSLPGGAGMTGAVSADTALAGRYVDEKGTPLPKADLTGQQFRRMPIYLRLLVDQRYISDVLVNCANCPMPIDVLWVLINPENRKSLDYASSAGTGGGLSASGLGTGVSPSMGGPPSSSGTIPSGRGGSGMGANPAGVGVGGGRSGEYDFGPNAVLIEIYGSINIFAPPDEQKIGGGM
jgi:hypothetical protein